MVRRFRLVWRMPVPPQPFPVIASGTIHAVAIGISTTNRTPVRVVEAFGLAICTAQVLVLLLVTACGVNALVTVAGAAIAGTVSTALVEEPWEPRNTEAPTVNCPALSAVTGTEKLQLPP